MELNEKILAELELANDLKLMELLVKFGALNLDKSAKFATFVKNNYRLSDERRGKIDDMVDTINPRP